MELRARDPKLLHRLRRLQHLHEPNLPALKTHHRLAVEGLHRLHRLQREGLWQRPSQLEHQPPLESRLLQGDLLHQDLLHHRRWQMQGNMPIPTTRHRQHELILHPFLALDLPHHRGHRKLLWMMSMNQENLGLDLVFLPLLWGKGRQCHLQLQVVVLYHLHRQREIRGSRSIPMLLPLRI